SILRRLPHSQRSLLDRTPRPVVAESTHAYDAFGWSPLRSIRIGEFKYIDAPKPELYHLAADPGERINLAARDPARAQSMRTTLAQTVAAHHPKRARGAALSLTPPQRAALTSKVISRRGRNPPRPPSPIPRIVCLNSTSTRTRRSRCIRDARR